MIVTNILWKSDSSASFTVIPWKYMGQFFNVRSMQDGFAGILQQVGLLFKLLNQYKLQKAFIASFSIPTLKSPKKQNAHILRVVNQDSYLVI